jgi:hypothetical protein
MLAIHMNIALPRAAVQVGGMVGAGGAGMDLGAAGYPLPRAAWQLGAMAGAGGVGREHDAAARFQHPTHAPTAVLPGQRVFTSADHQQIQMELRLFMQQQQQQQQ